MPLWWSVARLTIIVGLYAFLNSAIGVAHAQSPGTCDTWVQVNDGAFGLGDPSSQSPPYSGEEGFEVLVFKDQLYVGQEADNTLGARLWRTTAGVTAPTGQSDWEEVAADGSGNPFGITNKANADHIDSLAEFDGFIYASLANRSGTSAGTRVFRSSTGASGSWSEVTPSAGFGDTNNDNFKDMIEFSMGGTDYLCGGTGNSSTGAEVWCTSNGTTWTQKNSDGFGSAANALVASSGIFNNDLYLGVFNSSGGRVYRTSDLSTWTQVFSSSSSPTRPRVEIMGVLGGNLYIAEGAGDGRDASDPTIRIFRSSDGTTWTEVGTVIGTDSNNTRTIVDGATVYNSGLYVAVMNNTTGVEVWRTADGTTWTHVTSGNEGFSSAGTTFAAELIPFNGYLYAWTSNYTTGQQVMRTKCPICETQNITGTGTHNFTGVGADITFSDEDLDSVEVCAFPDAFPTAQTSTKPAKRHYQITPSPADGTFTAALTLSYTDDEFNASDISDENTTFLTRWTGSAWSDCPTANQSRDTSANEATCSGVTTFSTWAIAGGGATPASVELTSFRARTKSSSWQKLIHWRRWTWNELEIALVKFLAQGS